MMSDCVDLDIAYHITCVAKSSVDEFIAAVFNLRRFEHKYHELRCLHCSQFFECRRY